MHAIADSDRGNAYAVSMNRTILIAALLAGCGTDGDDSHELVPCEFEGATTCEPACVGFPQGDGPSCRARNDAGINDGVDKETFCFDTFVDADGRVGCCAGDGTLDADGNVQGVRFFECEGQ